MTKRKTLGTNCRTSPSAVALALAVNNSEDMRIRRRLKAENEKVKSSSTPTCELNSVDEVQKEKHVTELCSWKGKKNRNKPRKRHSNGVRHDYETGIQINDYLLVGNSSAHAMDDIKSGPMIGSSCQWNRGNNVESNKEAMQLEMKTNDATVALSGYVDEVIKDCKVLNPSGTDSADISPSLEARCSGPISTSRNICSSLQSYGKPFFFTNGKVDISLGEKCNQDDGVTNGPSEMEIMPISEPRGVITYARRKKKVDSSSKVDLNSIHEDTNVPIELTGPSRTENTSLCYSSETLSGGCSKDVDKKILIEGQASKLQVVEDVQVQKVTNGCKDLECSVGETEGRMAMDDSMGKTAECGFSKDKPSQDNLEKFIGQSKREKDVLDNPGEQEVSVKDEAFNNDCGNTPEEPVDCNSLERLSDWSNSRNSISTSLVNTNVNLSLGRSQAASSRKKLLVLDLNGLIADIVRYVPERHAPDAVISMKAVFKRPFYEDFLQFCFARFSVGVWSSRAKSNVQSVVDFLLGDAKQKLLFCWDQSHCTRTGFYTVENRHKPLLVKKLQKLWEKYEPDLPWDLGEFNEANTLMLDDSPYKALLNPPYTAIFPPSYKHTNKQDDSLGPGGALRIYLEGLANADDVQSYVKENPFGQRPITEKNASWRFYQKVIEAILMSPGNARNKCSTDEPDWGRGVLRRGQEDLNSADNTQDGCPDTNEQRAKDPPDRHMWNDMVRPYRRREMERRGGDWNSGDNHQRTSDSPNRHTLCDMDRPHRRRGLERRGGDWNSDFNDQRVNNHCDRYRFDYANRRTYGSRIQRPGGDWNRTIRDLDKRPVSDDQRASGYPSSVDTKGSDWRGIQRGSNDWSHASQDLDKRPVSDDQKDSGDSHRYSSADMKGSDWKGMQRGSNDWSRASYNLDKRPVSDDQKDSGCFHRYSSADMEGSDWRGIQRGSSDWSRGSRDFEKHPLSYDQKRSRYSSGYSASGSHNSDKIRGTQRGVDWNRAYQPLSLDQRVHGYPYSNGYSRILMLKELIIALRKDLSVDVECVMVMKRAQQNPLCRTYLDRKHMLEKIIIQV